MPGDMPDWYNRAFTSASEEEQAKASVTSTKTTITFSSSVHSWRIYNDGPNACHYALVVGVDTNAFKIPAKSWIMEDVPTTNIYLICATGETATVYATGVR